MADDDPFEGDPQPIEEVPEGGDYDAHNHDEPADQGHDPHPEEPEVQEPTPADDDELILEDGDTPEQTPSTTEPEGPQMSATLAEVEAV